MVILRISKSVISALKERISQGQPDLFNRSGELYIVPNDGMAAIVPKDPQDASEYLVNLQSVPEAVRPKRLYLLPTGDPAVPIFVMADVSIRDGRSIISDQEVTLLLP